MNDAYDEFTDLLGAYALDAVDPDEREQIERHLLECPRCRAEVAEHREVAAYLSQSGAHAPEGVWDRIASELSPPAPPLRLTFAAIDDEAPDGDPQPTVGPDAGHADVVPLGSRASVSRRTRTMGAIIAIAACIVAVLGVVAVGQSNRLNNLESAMNDRNLETIANESVAHSDLKVSLKGDAGSADVGILPNGQGYVLLGDDMAPPPDGSVYQLWGKVDGTVLSLGTFGKGTKVVPFSVDPSRLDDLKLLAVTQEAAPGVLASKNAPIMAGTV